MGLSAEEAKEMIGNRYDKLSGLIRLSFVRLLDSA